MRRERWLWLLVGVASTLVGSACWSLRAQDRGRKEEAAAAPSIQEALSLPFDLPFGEDTTLEEVRAYLARTLGGPVVLDQAALDRLELKDEDVVRLNLKGVRLKVGLRLLLAPVGLTFRVEPEDNLLILTDPTGTEDPGQRALGELKSLHREVHDLQDAVDDLGDLVEDSLGVEPDPRRNKTTLVRAGRRS